MFRFLRKTDALILSKNHTEFQPRGKTAAVVIELPRVTKSKRCGSTVPTRPAVKTTCSAVSPASSLERKRGSMSFGGGGGLGPSTLLGIPTDGTNCDRGNFVQRNFLGVRVRVPYNFHNSHLFGPFYLSARGGRGLETRSSVFDEAADGGEARSWEKNRVQSTTTSLTSCLRHKGSTDGEKVRAYI